VAKTYSRDYYEERQHRTQYSARVILDIALEQCGQAGSAAVPRQGGERHINEQWQSYWVKLFDALGYDVHDYIRSSIWNDEQMPCWYWQNTLFFTRRGLALPAAGVGAMPLDVVHPFLFLKRVKPRPRRLRDRLRSLLGMSDRA